MRFSAVLCIALIVTAVGARAQRSPDTPTTIRGVVVDANNGAVLPRVRIQVMADRTVIATVLSDDEGGFSFASPREAALSVRAVKAGFATIGLRVTPEQLRGTAGALRIEMPRGAAISGRVRSVRGQPQTSRALVVRRLGAVEPPLPQPKDPATVVAQATGAPDVTGPEFVAWPDDRGEFRIGGLSAGRYAMFPLGAVPLAASIPADSITVDLQPGTEAAGVEVILPEIPRPVMNGAQAALLTGTGSIRGRVVTTAGEPLVSADVIMRRGAGSASIFASTDALGRYVVPGVAAGSFTIEVSSNGYVRGAYGGNTTALPPRPLVLGEGEDKEGVDVILARASSVSGVVIDEHGDPVQDASVQLLRVNRTRSGAMASRQQGTLAKRTDDRGQFRLGLLVPGTYILMASVPPETAGPVAGRRLAYAPAYHPGSPDFASAIPIEIRSEEDLPGLTVVMRRVPVARVSGVVTNSRGRPFSGTVRLTSRPLGNISLEARVVHPDPDGTFVFADVPPGNYLVQALAAAGGSGDPEFANTAIAVSDRDPDPILLRTSPGATLTGRFVLEGASVGQPLWGYSVSTVPVNGALAPSSSATVSGAIADGAGFTLSALAGPTRIRFSSPDENWFLKSVLILGSDVVDQPFEFAGDGRAYTDVEVVFSRAAATVTGRASDDRGAPVEDFATIVFPVDRDKWFEGSRWLKLARSGADGTFRASGLPPGDYWIAAVDRLAGTPTSGEWQDPELLETLWSRATRATLGPGQAQAVTLRVIRP